MSNQAEMTEAEVAAEIQRVAHNDPALTHVALILDDKVNVVTSLTDALVTNTSVTSLALRFKNVSEDASAEVLTLLGSTMMVNTFLTEVEVEGIAIPSDWQGYLDRNTRLATPPPPTAPVDDTGPIDIERAPWAVEESMFAYVTARFRKKDRISGGSMGAVFRATFKDQLVAAKTHYAFQNPALFGLDDPQSRATVVAECMREIKALERIRSHENVIGFLGVAYGKYKGEVVPTWICMELAGTTLHERIRSGECKLYPDMFGMVNGLAYIHSLGMMHRDMKPKNILVSLDGQIKLGDFGFARTTDALVSSMQITMCGTPSYLAPEVNPLNRVYGAEVDVYAVGMIGMEMILEQSPSGTHAERMPEIAHAAAVSPEWAWFLQRCTTTDPQLRPSSHALALTLSHQTAVWAQNGVDSEDPEEIDDTLRVLRVLRQHEPDAAQDLYRRLVHHVCRRFRKAALSENETSLATASRALMALAASQIAGDAPEIQKDKVQWNKDGNDLLRTKNDVEGAEVAYCMAVRLDPKFANPWSCLGYLLETMKDDVDGAEEAYRTAIRLDPKDAYPWNNLGILLENKKDHVDGAEEAYRTAIQLDSRFPKPWNNLGLLLWQKKDAEGAAEAYRTAVVLDPRLQSSWNYLGALLQGEEVEVESARQTYLAAIRSFPYVSWG